MQIKWLFNCDLIVHAIYLFGRTLLNPYIYVILDTLTEIKT